MSKHVARGLGCAGGILLAVTSAPVFAGEAPAPDGPIVSKAEAKAPLGGPQPTPGGWTLDPIVDANLRYERVEQDNAVDDADALSLRLRTGLEAKSADGLSLLAEAEATLGIINDYNDTNPGNGVEPYSVVADPQNIELNRLQIAYESDGFGKLTLGRQRVILGDSRWVGNVGWRQNEQTFDAARLELKVIDPVTIDYTVSISQRTIFGIDADNRQAFDGEFHLINLTGSLAGVAVTGFAYLLDYDEKEHLGALATAMADTQTFGGIAQGNVPLGDDFGLKFKASYAVQSDYKDNPFGNFSLDYLAAELGADVFGFGLTGGYEQLSSEVSSTGARVAVQTPMATLHKFNGWADTFLVTPAAGIKDYSATLGKKLPGVKLLPGLNASVTYHKFESEDLGLDYGEEWDALVGFKLKGAGITFKYANYDADDFAVDTEKFWVQLGYAF